MIAQMAVQALWYPIMEFICLHEVIANAAAAHETDNGGNTYVDIPSDRR